MSRPLGSCKEIQSQNEMKKTVTKTVTETQTLCDHCGKELIYSEQACIVCRKCACHDCFLTHLVELRLDKFPKFWPPTAGIKSFHAYACPTCSNAVTRRFAAVKRTLAKRNAQCEAWHHWYLKEIEALSKAEAEFNRTQREDK